MSQFPKNKLSMNSKNKLVTCAHKKYNRIR